MKYYKINKSEMINLENIDQIVKANKFLHRSKLQAFEGRLTPDTTYPAIVFANQAAEFIKFFENEAERDLVFTKLEKTLCI